MAMVITLTLIDFSVGDTGIIFTNGSARVSNDGGSSWTTYNDTLILDSPGEWIVEELTAPTALRFDDGNNYIKTIYITGVASSIDCTQICAGLETLDYFYGDLNVSSLAAAFAGCSNLSKIDGKMTSQYLYGAFYACPILTCIKGINSTGSNTDLIFGGGTIKLSSPNSSEQTQIISGTDWVSTHGICLGFITVIEYTREVDAFVSSPFNFANRTIDTFSQAFFAYTNREFPAAVFDSLSYTNREFPAAVFDSLSYTNRSIPAPLLVQFENSRHVWARAIELYNISRNVDSNILTLQRMINVREVESPREAIIIKRINA